MAWMCDEACQSCGWRRTCRLLICVVKCREDECERVKRFGARILTLDQLEGLKVGEHSYGMCLAAILLLLLHKVVEQCLLLCVKDPTKQAWTTEEEDDGDPPRIWAPNAMYPGTAFTRSIGDSLAEQLGVTAEPEVVTAKLSADRTPLLVIASDGVFEFMSNQAVIQLVSLFRLLHFSSMLLTGHPTLLRC